MMNTRFGFDAPGDLPIEESIRWAGENGFGYIDFQADLPQDLLDKIMIADRGAPDGDKEIRIHGL